MELELYQIAIFILIGGFAGFIAGLVGVGGGVIFAPVLLFAYQTLGMPDSQITQVTIATSLLCTVFASGGGSYRHFKSGNVIPKLALLVGLFSIVAITLTTSLITTQPWYDKDVFRMVFGAMLVIVALRMLPSKKEPPAVDGGSDTSSDKRPWYTLAGIGGIAGFVSSAAGVGGGVVLVPSYNKLLKYPILKSVGSSTATITIITTTGVLNYIYQGYQAPELFGPLGFVDYKTGLLLAIPAIFTSQWGALVASKMDRAKLRLGFSLLAAIVAVRMIWSVTLGS